MVTRIFFVMKIFFFQLPACPAGVCAARGGPIALRVRALKHVISARTFLVDIAYSQHRNIELAALTLIK